MKQNIHRYTVLAIAIVNFLMPFYFILRNKSLDKKKKIKMLLRAVSVMGLILISAIIWVFFR